MSFLRRIKQAITPSTPASTKSIEYVDTQGRTIELNDTGVMNVLTARELPNFVRNSGFWFAQRQAPGSATTYSNTTGRALSADGWGITNENASATFQRIDTSGAPESGLQSRFYGQFLKITSTGKLFVSQALEGSHILGLRGRTVRLQAWIKGTGSSTVKMALVQLNNAGTLDTFPATFISAVGGNGVDPTLGTNLAFIAPKSGVTPDNASTDTNSIKCNITTSWQRFGACFDVPSNCKNLAILIWGDSQFTATNGFNLAQVSLTDGFEIQDWTPLPLELELMRVRRYYNKTFTVDTAPIQNAGSNTGELQGLVGKAGATALACQLAWRYPEEMRAAATTITTYQPNGASAQVARTSGTTPAAQTATATQNSTAVGVEVTATGDASGAVGDRCAVHITADAEL